MRFLLAAFVGIAALAAVSAQQPWSSCGTSADHLTVSSLTITPSVLNPGKPLAVALSGSLNEQVTGGKVALKVTYLGVTVFDTTQDLCQLAQEAGKSCPLPAGPVSVSQSATMPSMTPRGVYHGSVKVTDQNGQEITCVNFQMTVKPASGADLVHDEDIINFVNRNPQSTWTAGHNARFEGKTINEVRRMLRTRLANPLSVVPVSTVAVEDSSVPATFDARTQWPKFITPIRDQQQCGSCWAFSAAEALSDRWNIATKPSKQIVLSPQYLVSCDTDNYGCDGGYLDLTWQFLDSHGIPTDACTPYTSGGGDSGTCTTKCKDGSAMKFYKSKDSAQIMSVAAMQQSVVQYGPIQVAFSVYQDFMNYKSGVYKHTTGGLLGGHAVRLEGWGTSNGTPYWIIANSWGTSWGLSGYFWIAKGVNECGIESDVWAGQAAA